MNDMHIALIMELKRHRTIGAGDFSHIVLYLGDSSTRGPPLISPQGRALD